MRKGIPIICLVFLLMWGANLNSVSAYDIDQAIGLGYPSGFQDVVDFYDDVPWLEVDRLSPVGLFYRLLVNYDSGMRTDVGVGPLAFVAGGVEYHDVPVTATIGYNLNPKGSINPYLRGGLSYHFIGGDYVKDTKPVGPFGALGVEFMKNKPWQFFVEVAYDGAEATMKVDEYRYGFGTYRKTEDINPTGVMISAGFMF
jgi:hypothetical protein